LVRWREWVLSRNNGSLLILGTTAGSPFWITWPMMPSPGRYLICFVFSSEMPWAISIRISPVSVLVRKIIPRIRFRDSDNTLSTLNKDFFMSMCRLSASLISYKSDVSSMDFIGNFPQQVFNIIIFYNFIKVAAIVPLTLLWEKNQIQKGRFR